MYYCKKYTCNGVREKEKTIDTISQDTSADSGCFKHDCTASGILLGRVIEPFGQPVPYAVVKIVSESNEPILTAKTDRFGNYLIFQMPTNRLCKVMATAKNYSLNNAKSICIKERDVLELDILLCQSNCVRHGILTGTVLSQLNSLPIDRAQVLLYEEISGLERFKQKTSTNGFGSFALTRLSPGTYFVKISVCGYLDEQYRVDMTTWGQIVHRVISLCPANHAWKGTVSGVITDLAQKPIADADVILYSVADSGEATPIAYTRTNQNGIYLFIDIDVGTYQISAK